MNSREADLPAIEMQGLTKWYGRAVLALDSLNLTVRRGEVMGFLGPNGAGKTTTIRLLLDLIRPTSGRAMVFGLDCQRDSVAARQRTGYLSSDLRLYEGMSVRALLGLFASLHLGQVDWGYVEAVRRRLDLSLERRVGELSRGNRQKAGLVLALMHRPDLLILDEPTTGLDPLVQRQVLDVLRDVRAEGRTVFFSSHILSEVEHICDRVAIIRGGRLVAVEEVSALRGRRVQRLRITFAGPVDTREFAAIPGVRPLESNERAIEVEVAGDVDLVVKAAARHHVVALETVQATLEEVFMAYYGAEAEAPVRSEGDAG